MNGPNSDKNDPMEEFEFRPINEGLGFHRKQKNVTTSPSTGMKPIAPAASTGLKPAGTTASMSVSNSGSTSVSHTLTTSASASPFQSPLPRRDLSMKSTIQVPSIEDDSIAKAQTAVNDILKNLNHKRQLDFATETAKQKAVLKKSKPQFFAAILDGMLITAAFLMTLILMLSITKVDMILNLTHPETSGLVYLATFTLFAGVTFIYMVVNRTFLGYTPGEWAFDQQCGTDIERNELMYIPKIALRTLIVMATGFFILPFLSYLSNADIAGNLAGINLFKKPYGS